jgi:predicted glycosyltransferase
MSKTTLTLSDHVAQILKVYTVQSKSSLRAQSEVVEEALIEFFERHGIKIEV